MAWRPTLPKRWPYMRTQLGKGMPVEGRTQGSLDCNVRAWQHAIGYLTGDKAVPWVMLIRQWMGRTGQTGANLWNSQAAARNADDWLARLGRNPVRVYLKFTKKAAKRVIENGNGLMLAVDYAEWNRRMGKTGDPNYKGGHGIYVLGEKKWDDGTIVWRVYDSLEDNRRNSIPMGPKWRPRWKVLKAAEVWARKTNNTEVVAAVMRGGGKK